MHDPRDSADTQGWDTYWQGARDSDAYVSGGVSHPAFAAFWDAAFAEILPERDKTRVLDIATGSGAVIERLHDKAAVHEFDVSCVDISSAAIDSVCARFPGVTGIVANATDIPCDAGRFDLVTSQFGIEYAGLGALDEATRLLADNGTLLFLIHIRPGLIYDECAAARSAVERTQACEFVPRAFHFFEAGFAAVRGANRSAYEQAAAELNPSIVEVEAVLAEYGEHVAGDTISRLYSDVQRIHNRIQYHDPDEVLNWLRSMETELAQYEKRMASMCDAALDQQHFDGLCSRLRERGLQVGRAEAFRPDDVRLPLAWILCADRVR